MKDLSSLKKGSAQDGQRPITVFTGVPRSGTTFLGMLAQQHLDVGAVNEGPFELWLVNHVRDESRLVEDRYFDTVLARLVRHHYFMLLLRSEVPYEELQRNLRERIQARTISGIARSVLEFSADWLGRSRLGHEDPLLMNDLPKVLRAYPQCRLVHIVRDPRDVASSILKFPWGANNVVVAARDWKRQVGAAREIGAELRPERYLELRYENLLNQSADSMRTLMQFVCDGVDETKLAEFLQEMERNTYRRRGHVWHKQLSTRQVQLVEGICASQMRASGYETVTSATGVPGFVVGGYHLHNRAVQLARILRGRLQFGGGALLRPERFRGRKPDRPVVADDGDAQTQSTAARE